MDVNISDRERSRFPAGTVIFFIFFVGYYALQIVTFIFEVLRLVDMFNFYTHLLGIPDVRASDHSMWAPSDRRSEIGRHSNYFLARGSATHRSHPRGEPSYSTFIH